MGIEEIKKLLSDPKVKELVEAEIVKAVENKQTQLDEAKAELEHEKKKAKKELFIFKKMILAKSQLAEEKMKTVYETKLDEAVNKISKDVFSFIGTSVKSLTESVAAETKGKNDAEKVLEAFSQAMRVMAPHLNITELQESNEAVLEKYKAEVNKLSKEVTTLRGKVLSDDMNSLVVKECKGYPFEHQVVIVNSLKELAPKTLTEAKETITALKEKLRERIAEATVSPVTESKSETINEDVKLKTDKIKEDLLKMVTEMKKETAEIKKKVAPVSEQLADPFDLV